MESKHWICNRKCIPVELKQGETAIGVDRG